MNAPLTAEQMKRDLYELPEGMLERELTAAIHNYRVRYGVNEMRERVAEAVLFEMGERQHGNS